MAARFLVSGGTGNWNSTTNWSDTSGGAAGASFPTSADDVTFDTASANASITTNVASAALSLTVSGTYAGTITMTNTLTISGAATFLSTMVISGSAHFILQATATHTSNGKLIPNLTLFATGATRTHTLADNFTVTNLVFNSAAQNVVVNGFTININGNLTLTAGSPTGTTNLIMDGTGTWSGPSGLALSLTFNSAGTITISGSVAHTAKTITYTAGTMVVAGSSCSFGGTQTINTSGMTWNNINNLATSGTITLTSNISAVNVSSGNTSSDGTINGFTVFASGNLTFTQTTGRTLGTTVFTMIGTGTLSSTNSGTSLVTGLTQNPITLNTTGTITISGLLRYGVGTFLYTAGTVVTTGSTFEVVNTATVNTTGITWNNVMFSSGTITSSSNMDINGTLTIGGTTTAVVLTGNQINASGNITINLTTVNCSGTTVIVLDGVNQTITSAMTSGRWSNNITIASTGSVFFTTGVKYSGVMTHTSGKVLGLIDIDWPPVPSSVLFNESSGTANEYVNIDAVRTALATTTVGTWSCWVKPIDITNDGVFISFGDTNAATIMYMYMTTAGKLQCYLNKTGAGAWLFNSDDVVFTNNVWTHVGLVQNATAPVAYINGALIPITFSVVGSPNDKTLWFNYLNGLVDNGRIGSDNWNNGNERDLFSGSIGDVIFWNTNLSAAQITTLYNSGQAILPIANLPAYANVVSHFNMGLGDTFPTLTDDVGGNNGTMTNQEASDIIIINRTVFS